MAIFGRIKTTYIAVLTTNINLSMKNLCVLLLMIITTGYCFGQSSASAEIDKGWGPWKQSGCFKGLFFRVQRDHYDRGTNKLFYLIEFQNRYNKRVGFTFYLFNPATEKPKDVNPGYTFGDASVSLMPGKVYRTFEGVIGEGNAICQIFDVCFVFNKDGQTSCTSGPYNGNGSFAECDNGIPNYIVYTAADQANAEAAEEAAKKKAYDPNYTYKGETSPGRNVNQRSPTDKLLDVYAKTLGVKNSGTTSYSPGPATSPVVTERQPAIANPSPVSEVTENDFAMDVTPYSPLNAKEQAERFVAGFAKRSGVLTLPSGVLYQMLTPGTGVKPTATDNVKINFRKTTVVGKQYMAVLATDKAETINVGEIGPNLAEGIKLMNVGSKYCFVFPAPLAGKQPDYPAGSVTIVWVIDLLEVVK
ncbi:FKBP-type peptidyl-prolyl cis-trans isomerase [Mucilaginibacter psychrotolerans]|uniref:Uncharacterized protein n=1 Tax=Mucilaginibacter psychrotolerans TaxID=1524096 RepID=A0A4Y8SL09_9SPHI|nr:hypothetical protein [Mucilaginibacter psychrotolerans]TFF39739.1 hypothetical protein E2R66_05070 [Mucilaginibacter psychrotolerans]